MFLAFLIWSFELGLYFGHRIETGFMPRAEGANLAAIALAAISIYLIRRN